MDLIINFDSIGGKQKLFDVLKQLKGTKLIKIEKYSKKRSSPQNRYYHAVVLKYLSETTGFSLSEMHEVLKAKFLPYERANRVTSEVVQFGRSTTELNTLQYEEFLEQVRVWALNELDCLIPLPNEVID
jgi:hypothetical protein